MAEVNVGYALANLFLERESYQHGVIAKTGVTIEELTSEIAFIHKVLANIRKERQKDPDSDVDLSAQIEQLMRLREVCERAKEAYPDVFDAADPVPFADDIDLNAVEQDYLEWVDTSLHNIETKRQSEIQNEMSGLEGEILLMKQLTEIVSQIMKSLRESQSYYTRKTGQ